MCLLGKTDSIHHLVGYHGKALVGILGTDQSDNEHFLVGILSIQIEKKEKYYCSIPFSKHLSLTLLKDRNYQFRIELYNWFPM